MELAQPEQDREPAGEEAPGKDDGQAEEWEQVEIVFVLLAVL
jgi:hypothetical protein